MFAAFEGSVFEYNRANVLLVLFVMILLSPFMCMPYSSMAPLSKKDKHLLGCSPPSIPIPRYLSAIYNSHYSCVILCIIFLSSLGSAVQLSLV